MMKAKKIMLCVTVEVLSIDSAPSLLAEVICALGNETVNGKIGKADGDSVTWIHTETEVEF